MPFTESFLDKISEYALSIVQQQQGENRLQDASVLRQKFVAEMYELATTSVVWDELPDVTYYAACLWLQGDQIAYELLLTSVDHWQVTFAQLEAATLAKYQRRAAGMPKDIEAERAVIMEALESVKK